MGQKKVAHQNWEILDTSFTTDNQRDVHVDRNKVSNLASLLLQSSIPSITRSFYPFIRNYARGQDLQTWSFNSQVSTKHCPPREQKPSSVFGGWEHFPTGKEWCHCFILRLLEEGAIRQGGNPSSQPLQEQHRARCQLRAASAYHFGQLHSSSHVVSAEEMSVSRKPARSLKKKSLLFLCEAVSWEWDKQSSQNFRKRIMGREGSFLKLLGSQDTGSQSLTFLSYC